MILDSGPWKITPQMELQSDDFTHDVTIKMNGVDKIGKIFKKVLTFAEKTAKIGANF